MVRIRRFGIVKTATTVAVLYVVFVAVIAIPFVAIAALTGGVPNTAGGGTFGAGEILVLAVAGAVFYAIFGWIATAVACAIYNAAARFTGGIEVEAERVAPPAPAPAWGVAPGASGPAGPAGPATPG